VSLYGKNRVSNILIYKFDLYEISDKIIEVMNMNIRKATLDDKKQIALLFSDENDYHVNLQPDVFNNLTENVILTKNWFENILRNDSRYMFVAEIKNHIVGLILFTIHQLLDDPLYKQKKWINIDELTVLKSHRGKGIGKRLLAVVNNYAKQTKAESIRLEVWENNESAIQFYKNNKFKIKQYILWRNC